ncbi:permease prefix domain 1-containing protein [Pseudobutyrivibrio sp.]|uniref:permease prefix domain 1-containing protein n=1 Tax=Pseudobutyrivibrio sp. TaxID=2014367 RepID=UPI001B0F0F4A|nr:permease prefix domain 1-containing protein [Pseudobutyrivibrio sp.]MBO5618225.1 hypothetical protein [Pseudobutyrivibrio sp.]MBP3262247.1 hypothetical protein [Pseudobutyrivibrio sp.]
METIRNYLDAMFANMPNTPEVKKAKAELLTMMEDKYNELIAEGETENSAVGTVISEFGNLDELAEDLGLSKEVEETKERVSEKPRRFVSMDEVKDYLDETRKDGLFVGIGVMLCIMCVVPVVLLEGIPGIIFRGPSENIGIVLMFLMIAVAVAMFVYRGIKSDDWKFLKKEPCQVDMATAQMVKDRKNSYKSTHALLMTIGVVLCVLCWIPAAVVDFDFVGAFLFVFIGIGVFLFIYSSTTMGSFDTILKLNDEKTISGSYGKEDDIVYINKTATIIMEVYWTTVTCIYLMVSFITFDWGRTWIIWIIGAIVHHILKIALAKED